MHTNRVSAAGAAGLSDRRTFLRRLAATALATGGAVLLPSCGDSDDEASSTAGSNDLRPVTYLTPIPPENLTFMAELLAIADGYFAEAGLSVTMERMRGSAQAVQGVLSELALVSRVSDIELMLAAGERGASELINVGTLYKDSTIRLVSGPDDPVRTAEDLAGKLVGIPSEGGASELTIDLVAHSAGVSDYEKQVVGLSAGTYDLVESGRIDCYMTSLDTSVTLKQARDAVVLMPGESIFAGGQCFVSNLTALNDEDSPATDIVNGFMHSLAKSAEAVVADRDNNFANVFAILRESYSFDSLMNDDIAVPSATQLTDSWLVDGEDNVLLTTSDRWQGVYDELVDAGSLEPGLDADQWYTNQFLE